MQAATDETVLGRFDGETFTHHGTETTFFKSDGKFWIRTGGFGGEPSDFEVKYTFGITPLQQYLIEMPGGRLQAFTVAWDSRSAKEGGQRWYDLYPDRRLVPGDPLHWTGLEQNWNHQCAWCHSTNVKKNYDPTSKSFRTTWSEISVGCESCHGPASRHLAWASKAEHDPAWDSGDTGFDQSLDDRNGVSWSMDNTGRAKRSQSLAGGKEILVCAGCHARREQFADDAADVRMFLDAFRASLLDPPLYYTDGQQRDEVYTYASFRQSKMHAAGVTCSDCHNAHSGKLRMAGNAVCTQCHAQARFDTAAHHHHAEGTAGAQCTNCHMPTTVYMGVDARHDHSMRLPRPDRTASLGAPNACNTCHADKSVQWAVDAWKRWYPAPKSGAQTFAEGLDLGDRGAPGAQSALIEIAADPSLAGVVRASAVARLARYPSPTVVAAIEKALQDDDPDVRAAAVSALSFADAPTRKRLLARLLKDEIRIVRMEAARQMAGGAERLLSPEEKLLFDKALAEYIAAQRFNADRPESLTNLGELYLTRDMLDFARRSFREALAVDPTFFQAAISLADLERVSGDDASGEAVLLKALERSPKAGALLHALGLNLVRQKRVDEAVAKLEEAARLAPEEARFAYVHAVALHGTGKTADAVSELRTALDRHPYDKKLITALISYQMEIGDLKSALPLAERLGQLEPERADIQQLILQLKHSR